jgi:hypothetical protein
MKTVDQCMAHPEYSKIKIDTIETINLYVTKGCPPGSFVEAVLSNDLMESFCRADRENFKTMGPIASYIYNEIPGRGSGCWGSRDEVQAWIDRGGLEGHKVPIQAGAVDLKPKDGYSCLNFHADDDMEDIDDVEMREPL